MKISNGIAARCQAIQQGSVFITTAPFRSVLQWSIRSRNLPLSRAFAQQLPLFLPPYISTRHLCRSSAMLDARLNQQRCHSLPQSSLQPLSALVHPLRLYSRASVQQALCVAEDIFFSPNTQHTSSPVTGFRCKVL